MSKLLVGRRSCDVDTSVVRRTTQVLQPVHGYLPVEIFDVLKFEDSFRPEDYIVNDKAKIGLVVDYMTRFLGGVRKEEAFRVSLEGARLMGCDGFANDLLKNIVGIDDKSIKSAFRLVGFDVAVREGTFYFVFADAVGIDEGHITDTMVQCIREMLIRSTEFLAYFGGIKKCNLVFKDGYSSVVVKGDGDFCTADTLWDMKCTRFRIEPETTLQIAMYYLMGYFSGDEFYRRIKYVGVFNPRLNIAMRVRVSDISDSTWYVICRDVMGYRMRGCSEDWRTDVIATRYSELDLGVLKHLMDSNSLQDLDGMDRNGCLAPLYFAVRSKSIVYNIENCDDGIYYISTEAFIDYCKDSGNAFVAKKNGKLFQYRIYVVKGDDLRFVGVDKVSGAVRLMNIRNCDVGEPVIPEVSFDEYLSDRIKISIMIKRGCRRVIKVYRGDEYLTVDKRAEYVLVSGVQEIQAKAFYGLKDLKEVFLMDGVQEIGNRAFSESGLEALRIPSSTVRLGDCITKSCRNLKQIVIPKHLFKRLKKYYGDKLVISEL